MKYLEFLIASLFWYLWIVNGDQLVKIHQGLIKGTTMKTRNGREISIFLGIPYAEPPIGERRFSNPIPAKYWEGLRLADKEGNFCPQIEVEGLIGEEDCLYLNVFTPQLNFNKSKSINKNDLLPVMVRIHGGGFLVGSSNFTYYGPNYLLDKDIILVSINFRLGILGFFATKDSVVPGNFGLKDQVLALKWVKKNIKFFGGDPNRVTLFGESAGGACVGLHAISNASNGLFHQYIFQSGSALGPWAFRNRRNLDPYVNDLIKNVNCPEANSTIIVKCLREKSIFKLLNAVPYDGFNFSKLAWIPTDEIKSKDAFLTESPENLIRQNKLKNYASISGNVGDEGLPVTLSFYANPTNYESLLLALEKYINSTACHYMKPNNVSKFSKMIHNFYFNESVVADKNEVRKSFTKFVSDCRFIYPQVMLLERMTKVIKSPFYIYLFNYRGNESVVSLENGIKGNIGVTHGEELLYHFPKVSLSDTVKVDQRMIDIMVDLWTSFAISGKPTSNFLSIPDLWQPYMQNASFLQIGNPTDNNDPSITVNQDFFNDRMNFWKENFPWTDFPF